MNTKRMTGLLAGLCVVGAMAAVLAAGSVTVTRIQSIPGIERIDLAWTSSAGGAVSGNTLTLNGRVLQVKFVPGSGASQPDDLYDVTLVDAAGVDLLTVDGVSYGANLSNAAASVLSFDAPVAVDGASVVDLQVANAGAANGGTVSLWVLR